MTDLGTIEIGVAGPPLDLLRANAVGRPYKPEHNTNFVFRNIRMFNFLFIRTGVIACLIAAMVIQPFAVFAGKSSCVSAACESDGGLVREARPGSRGCCKAESGTSCCCSKGHTIPRKSDGAKKAQVKACCANVSDKRDSKEYSGDQQPRVVCMCGVRSLPAVPPAESSATNLVRVAELAYFATELDFSSSQANRYSLDSDRSFPGLRPPHFAQRLLCIWRI